MFDSISKELFTSITYSKNRGRMFVWNVCNHQQGYMLYDLKFLQWQNSVKYSKVSSCISGPMESKATFWGPSLPTSWGNWFAQLLTTWCSCQPKNIFFWRHHDFMVEDRSISKHDYYLGHCLSSSDFFQTQNFGGFFIFYQQLQGFLLVRALLKVLVLLTGCLKKFFNLNVHVDSF